MSAPVLILLAIAIPLGGAVLIAMSDRRPNQRDGVTLVTAGALFAVVAMLLPQVLAGARPQITLIEVMPGAGLAFRVEPLGMLFAAVASFLWIVTSIYSIGYMRAHHERHQTRFYVCFAVALSSAMGVAFAADLFTLFVFYEALTISTYPLVTHSGTEEARRAGRTYLGILLGTSIGLFLLAIIWTFDIAGTLAFRQGGIFPAGTAKVVLAALLALYVFGIGKAAVMPLHRWLPAAMVAPAPVSALLHAVAVVKAGVFAVLKIAVYVFGIDTLASIDGDRWLAYVAAATILIASLVAMRQDNLKLRLAYSTVSQLSYIVLGALLANPLGAIGGAMHIAMHAFGKITLFFCAGAIDVALHKKNISDMRGIGRAMPFTMAAFFVASLSIIGLPPLGGLWSKWYLGLGTLEAGDVVLLAVLMLSSLLNIAYLLPIPIRAFFAKADAGAAPDKRTEAPVACLIAIAITAAGCIALFFHPDPIYRLARLMVAG